MRFAIVAFLLAACGSSSNEPERAPESHDPQVAVPEVAGNGYGALPADAVVVVITKTGLVVEGQPIVKITDGKVDASELEGGALGMKIVKLSNYAAAFLKQRAAEHPGPEPTFAISMDPSLPYRLLISTMYSIKSAPAKRFAVVARAGGRLVALPLVLPEKRPVSDRGYVTALTTRGAGGRRPGADLARQIEEVKNGSKTVEVKPPFKTIGKQLVTPPSTLTGEIVGAKIATAYIEGIRRCASKKPGHHALELSFGVDPSGRANGLKVTGEPGDVADCLGGLVAGWRFPIAKDGNGAAIAVTATIGIELDVQTPSKTGGAPRVDRPQITEDDAAAIADKLTSSPADDDAASGGNVAVMQPPPVDERDRSLGLFVSITRDEMIVWSVTALEGTLREPKARIKLGAAAMGELSKVLAEIVQRRWGQPGQPRAAETKTIVIQAEGATPVQLVAEVLGAVRAGPDGRELFPDIQLSAGFE